MPTLGGHSGHMSSEQPASLHPTELLRRLENTVRLGTIAAVRHEAPARCRVKTGGNTTDWLPWITGRAGKDRTWWAPEVGEQVLVFSPGGNLSAGVVMPGCYSDSHPQPDDDPEVSCIEFEDGVRIEYNRARHVLTISSPMLVELCAGQVLLDADVYITRKLHIQGDAYIAGKGYAQGGLWPAVQTSVPPMQRSELATGGGQ